MNNYKKNCLLSLANLLELDSQLSRNLQQVVQPYVHQNLLLNVSQHYPSYLDHPNIDRYALSWHHRY